MNLPMLTHSSPTGEALRQQAASIYSHWKQGNKLTARAMMHQIPPQRIAQVVFTMTMLAVSEGDQHAFSRFIEGLTQ